MTRTGIISLISIIYLSLIICFVISLNENRDPKRMIKETLRRWGKFMLVTIVIGFVVYFIG